MADESIPVQPYEHLQDIVPQNIPPEQFLGHLNGRALEGWLLITQTPLVVRTSPLAGTPPQPGWLLIFRRPVGIGTVTDALRNGQARQVEGLPVPDAGEMVTGRAAVGV